MKKAIYLLFTTTLIVQWTYSQSEFTPLAIGDKLPDLVFENTLYNGDREIRLSDYRGQLLILDFWATWCSPCIAAFPKLDSLNREIEGLTILPVTYESEEQVEKLFRKLSKLKETKIPMLYDDNSLRFLFPHTVLPHSVWIGPNGEFLTMTGGEEINLPNIFGYLENGDIPTAKKMNLPTLAEDTPLDPEKAFYKVLFSDFDPERTSIYRYFSKTKDGGSRFLVSNMAPYTIFWMAFKDPFSGGILPSSNIQVELSEPERFITYSSGDKLDQWFTEHAKCLEIEIPPFLKHMENEIFQQEVQRLFPYAKAIYDKKVGKVYSLYFTGEKPSFLGDGEDSSSEFDFTGFSVKNASIGWITGNLATKYLQHLEGPILNKTGIKNLVTLSIDADLSDLNSINQALAAYDLEFREELDEITILRIIDADNTIK